MKTAKRAAADFRGRKIALAAQMTESAAAGSGASDLESLVEAFFRDVCSLASWIGGAGWFEAERFFRFSVFFETGVVAPIIRRLDDRFPKSAFGIPLSVGGHVDWSFKDSFLAVGTVSLTAVGTSLVRTAAEFSDALSPFGTATDWARAGIFAADAESRRTIGRFGQLRGSLGRAADPAERFDPERFLLPALVPPELAAEIAERLRTSPPDVGNLWWRDPGEPSAESPRFSETANLPASDFSKWF